MLRKQTWLRAFFSVPEDNPDLAIAQIRTFSRQIPIMYCMVIVNTLALAYSHHTMAPDWLTVHIPAVLTLISVFRTYSYWHSGSQEISPIQACRQLRQTIVLAGGLGAVFSIWALALFSYGNAYTQGHVAFFSSVTCLGIMVCLMHLKAAATMLAITAVGPTALFLLYADHQEFTAVGLNLIVVAVAILYVLSNHSRSFVDLISNQSALKKSALEAYELGKENERLANMDSLTGLPNRRRFMAELDFRLKVSKEKGESFAVGILDLDGFKPINDVYGHVAGDRLLVKVGQRLSQIGSEVFVARLGGDEFGIIFQGALSNTEIQQLGDHICGSVEVPFELENFTANIGATFGISRFPDAGSTAKILFEHSDYVLYVAKERLRGQAILFSEMHQAEINETTGIMRGLQEADMDEEFSVNYQFVVDGQTGIPVGAEALARWTSPVLGMVSPSDFIKNAEKSGLINQVTETLLRKTLAEVSKWPGDLFISFNLSAHDIGSSHHINRISEIVQRSNFPPERLTFEITETALLRDLNRAHDTLQLLKGLGSKIALDDFGTGYSSLSYVQNLPIDRLKIDRSFLHNIDQCRTSQAVVKAILDLCENLDLDCIVEGVETEQQLEVLQDLGCMKVQGYLFSKPLANNDAVTYLQLLPETKFESGDVAGELLKQSRMR
jgi:diguanylate cyclase (GGDEF)-like protein